MGVYGPSAALYRFQVTIEDPELLLLSDQVVVATYAVKSKGEDLLAVSGPDMHARRGPVQRPACSDVQLGGDPNDPRNLWVEPPSPGHTAGAGPNNPRDVVETNLHTAVCAGTTTLAKAQQAIATDWSTALTSLGIG